MFTGIIEDIGKVERCSLGVLSLDMRLNDISQGESLSVNGVCLTARSVTSMQNRSRIEFDFTPETEARTNIGKLRKDSLVNLERALQVGGRFGGHIMTGHIEGIGTLSKKTRDGNSWVFVFAIDSSLSRYTVPKGSVGVDGISLTVVDSVADSFSVSVIPHTLNHTNLQQIKQGDKVNIEPDILAKYVEHLLDRDDSRTITAETLKKHGFLP